MWRSLTAARSSPVRSVHRYASLSSHLVSAPHRSQLMRAPRPLSRLMATYAAGYSSGNYEAFARPRKPEGVEQKTAHFVGSGIASLAGAVFLIRDAHMDGRQITIYEQDKLLGGALDGAWEDGRGWVARGGRELEDHYECLWDLFRSIPSLEYPQGPAGNEVSVLDEFYWLNKDDPNKSNCRVTVNRGENAQTNNEFRLTPGSRDKIKQLFLKDDKHFEMMRIDEHFDEEFFQSNFWIYWCTMFGYERWHSALEMKLYFHRFIHHIGGLGDMSALKFTKYNQYDSFVLPLRKFLVDHGVNFEMGVTVTDVDFEHTTVDGRPRRQATRIHLADSGDNDSIIPGSERVRKLTENDLLFMTIGSLVENSDNGNHHTPAKINTGHAPAWEYWRRLVKKNPGAPFGNPDRFCTDIQSTKWQSATVTTTNPAIIKRIEEIAGRPIFHEVDGKKVHTGRVVTGGIITARDSKWLLSWTVSRQPHFKKQGPDEVVVWLYGLYVTRDGDYIQKHMQECTGEEITQEWLYHMGFPVEDIPKLASKSTGTRCVPTMMPYVTSFFMPRERKDRPDVIPEGATNFAFLGQFAQSETRDCIFTTEYSVRTAMEAVYRHLGVERGIPEVFNSTYDARTVVAAMTELRDGEELHIPLPGFVKKWLLKQMGVIGELLVSGGLVETGGELKVKETITEEVQFGDKKAKLTLEETLTSPIAPASGTQGRLPAGKRK